MSATYTTRLSGVETSSAIKAPVKVATTANITLSAAQTVDGVAVVAGDRVLVKNQTDATENGIWNVATGAWSRATDWNGTRDVVQGTLVYIISGTANSRTFWELTTASPDIGTSSLTFSRMGGAVVEPEEFGDNAVPGTTDMTAHIQAAIDRVEALGGGIVRLRATTYFVSSTLTVDSGSVAIAGEGGLSEATTIKRSGDYGDTLLVTGDDATGTLLDGFSLSGVCFEATAATTSGGMVVLNGVRYSYLTDFSIKNGYRCLDMRACTQTFVSNFFINVTNLYSEATTGRRLIRMTSGSANYSHPSCGGVFVDKFNCRTVSPLNLVQDALEINSADGIWFSTGHFGGADRANIRFNSNDAAEKISLVHFSNVMCDGNTGDGVNFAGNSSTNNKNITFDGCQFRGGGVAQAGVRFTAAAAFNNVRFSDCYVFGYTEEGCILNSADLVGFAWDNNEITECSDGNAATSHGLRIEEGSAINILGGSIGGKAANRDATADHNYGAYIGENADDVTIDHIDLTNNTTGPLSVHASATNVRIGEHIVSDSSVNVASAATIAPPPELNRIQITGTTDISTITHPAHDGKRLTLVFNGQLEVLTSGNIVLDCPLNTKLETTLDLVFDGTDWREVGRSGASHGTYTAQWQDEQGTPNQVSFGTVRYWRDGPSVTVFFDIENLISTAGMTGTDRLCLTLPFAAQASQSRAFAATHFYSLAAGTGPFRIEVEPGDDFAIFRMDGETAANSEMTVSDISTGVSGFRGATLTYLTDA